MKKRKGCFFEKALAAVMTTAVALSPVVSAAPVYAATSDTTNNNTAAANNLADADVIDMSLKGSLTIHKYDITAAEAAKDYTEGIRIANGQTDSILEQTMEQYAVEGVQFTYLRVGNIETYSDTEGAGSKVGVIYEIPEALADILKLDVGDAYDMTASGVADPCGNAGVLHYSSTQLSDALASILDEDQIAAKNALETYVYDYRTQGSTIDQDTKVGAVNMAKTDKNGVTSVGGLELGLYIVLETEVPEQVTDTCNPWFVSLPFTNITSTEGTPEGGDYWLYDMVCYPKNQTGNPTLDKSVRNAYNGTSSASDKNGAVDAGVKYSYDTQTGAGSLVIYNDDTNATNTADVGDAAYVANRGGYTADGVTAGKGGAGYSMDFAYRDTTTASAGDILDYILVSKLPHITSNATFLSEYTFTDSLSQGITYNKDVKIAFYDNAKDANANNTANAILTWNLSDPTYQQKYAEVTVLDENTGSLWADGSTQMTVSLTEEGLAFINGKGTNGGDPSDDGLSDKYIVVYYTATVNSDSTLVLGDEGNENDVVLTWSRTSDGYYNILEDRNYVYAYSLELTKEFSDGEGDFSKVGFKLYNSTDAYYVTAKQADDFETSGIYYVTGKDVDKESAVTFTPNTDGKIIIYGLEADSYEMTEIATANGYTLLKDSVFTTIQATDREINASVAGVTGMDQSAVDAIVQYYHGGIYDENGDLVTESKDLVAGGNGNRSAVQTANGRTIGKTDMYVGAVIPATATVDNVRADMKAHVYTKGNTGVENTSANATVMLHVVNNKNFELPKTGGFGTLLFTLGGCAAAFAGVLIVTKKSKKKEE